MITLSTEAPQQLDLFAQAPQHQDDGAVVDWDKFVVYNLDRLWAINRANIGPWGSRPHGSTCGECGYFCQSDARTGLDGYCSFHAFSTHGDPRPGDGTGWFFYAFGQTCTVTP